MFRPVLAIFRLSQGNLRSHYKHARARGVEIPTQGLPRFKRSLNIFDIISLLCRNSISPGFPGTVLGLWVLKYVFWCHAKLVSGRRVSRIFPDHKNTTFLRTPTYILTLSSWEKSSRVEEESHQPVTDRKDHDRETKMCRLVTVECGLRLRRMRNRMLTF